MLVVWYLLAQRGTRLPSPCHGANLLEGSEVQSVSAHSVSNYLSSFLTGSCHTTHYSIDKLGSSSALL